MRWLILFSVLLSHLSLKGQTPKKSEEDILSVGNANFGELIYQLLDTSSLRFPQIYFQYNEKRDSLTYLRFGISAGINTEKSGNIRFYNFIPANIYVGIQKNRLINKITVNYGVDLFFSMSLRGSRLQASWQADDYGAGITLFTGLAYPLSGKFSIRSEVNVGGGLFRTYKNVGNTTVMRFPPKFYYLKPVSIGIQYQL